MDRDGVYRRLSYLTPADAVIIQYLSLEGRNLILTGGVIAENTGYAKEYMTKRLRELTDRGLVERVSHGHYRLTETGLALANGEIQPEDLEPDDDEEEEGGEPTDPDDEG